MTREEAELSEEQHYAQFRNEDGIDKDGYYPGQRAWEAKHTKEIAAQQQAEAEEFERAEAALLAEIERD